MAAVPSVPIDLKNNTVIVDAKNAFHRFETVKLLVLTSIANRTPPIGAPNVQVTPTATAAVKN
jgi:hypothetical protein